jgi:hypothetical protein
MRILKTMRCYAMLCENPIENLNRLFLWSKYRKIKKKNSFYFLYYFYRLILKILTTAHPNLDFQEATFSLHELSDISSFYDSKTDRFKDPKTVDVVFHKILFRKIVQKHTWPASHVSAVIFFLRRRISTWDLLKRTVYKICDNKSTFRALFW